jgi:PIN domain nuclease of toxin-antitoxin system
MIVLDTHILVWWVHDPQMLSSRAVEIIEKERHDNSLLVSSISVWEIYMLVSKQRLKLHMDTDSWIERIESLSFIQFIPVDNTIAGKSVLLPEPFHSDPADRIIVATARHKGVALVTADERIRNYPHIQSIW